MPRIRSASLFPLAALLALGGGALFAQSAPDYTIRQLSPNGESASRLSSTVAIDRRGEWVAFAGDVEFSGAEAVYAVRRNGSGLHRLSPYGALGAIVQVEFSADGRRVIYLGDLELNGRDEIWSVAPWSSAASAVKLNVAVTGFGVVGFRVPPSGSRIAYWGEVAGESQAWSVPATGPSASGTRIDPGLVGDEIPVDILPRPDGAHVLITFVDSTSNSSRIFTVPIAGPGASAVLLASGQAEDCLALPMKFTPDSSRLLYAVACPPLGFQQIWSGPANGPAEAAVSLGGSFATGGQVADFAISPDSQWLVFAADRLVNDRVELFSVPVAGPASELERLNPTLVANGDVVAGIQISPDSSRVAYIADQVSDERYFPYSVPIEGPSSEAVTLYQGVLAVSADVQEIRFTPDSSRVVFRFDLAEDQRFDLYWAPADGSSPQARITNRGSNPAPDRSVTESWTVHPDGARVIYVFDEFALDDDRGLGEQRLVGPYESDARLNGVPAAGGKVISFALYPDAAGLLYVSDQAFDGKLEAFTVDLRLFGDGFEPGDSAGWNDLP